MLTFLSQLKILRIAEICVCNFESASLGCGSTNEDTHSINWDSVEKALRATLQVDVVPPERSGWSIFNPVLSCTTLRTKIIDWWIVGEVGAHFNLPLFKW